MSQGTVIHNAIDAFCKVRGFTRRGSTWSRRGDDIITMINLQKSQYGQSYYVNWGFVLFPDESTTDKPAYRDCGIAIRLGRLLAEEEKEIGWLLDLEVALDDETRSSRITSALVRAEQLLAIASVEDLRRRVVSGVLRGGAIDVSAQRALGVRWQEGGGFVSASE
jgi:hypothetical protein